MKPLRRLALVLVLLSAAAAARGQTFVADATGGCATGATSCTISGFTTTSVSGSYLVVSVASHNNGGTQPVVTATWHGVSMTVANSVGLNVGYNSLYVFKLANPDVGAYSLVPITRS